MRIKRNIDTGLQRASNGLFNIFQRKVALQQSKNAIGRKDTADSLDWLFMKLRNDVDQLSCRAVRKSAKLAQYAFGQPKEAWQIGLRLRHARTAEKQNTSFIACDEEFVREGGAVGQKPHVDSRSLVGSLIHCKAVGE
jgi:hypothetical protein